MSGKRFAVMREVRTGSWLGLRHQGKGIGKRMRRAVLRLAFDGLGAHIAHSGALAANEASRAVSRALGYEDNGRTQVAPRGEPVWEQLLILTRDRWAAHATDATETHGLAACLPLFGLT
jgi:RimJ/RimL family protein N-acetyltransferase